MKADPRETKLPVWSQNSLADLRRAVRELREAVATLSATRPVAGSDLLVQVEGGAGQKFAGLGHRAKVRCPIGLELDAYGLPRYYVEMLAHREPVTFPDEPGPVVAASIRGSDSLLIKPDVSNGITVFVRKK